MRHDPRFQIRALAAAALLALALPASAQSSNATLRGSIAATGTAVGGAEITATNTASGYVTRTRSNADGSYALVGLPPGTYRIVAEAAGQRSEQVAADRQDRFERFLAIGLGSHASTRGPGANRVCADPMLPIETLADEQHVSRRQLERDFGRWIGTSPRHLAQVARVQAVSRKAQAGAALADIAADVGFADQAHPMRGLDLVANAQDALSSARHSDPAWPEAIAGGPHHDDRHPSDAASHDCHRALRSAVGADHQLRRRAATARCPWPAPTASPGTPATSTQPRCEPSAPAVAGAS